MTAARRAKGDGSIVQRKNGSWAAVITVGYDKQGRQKRRWLTARSKSDARLLLNRAKQQQDAGTLGSDGRTTVEQFLRRWLEETVKPWRKPNTYNQYEATARLHLIPMLGRTPLAKLTPQAIQRLLNDKRAGGASPRQVALIRATLRTALSEAVRHGIIGQNPAKLTNPIPLPSTKPKPLPSEDARRILDALSGDRLEALYTVALAAGLRISEALGLTWPNVDLERGTLRVDAQLARESRQWVLRPTKTDAGRGRVIHLPGFALDALRSHRWRQLEERLARGRIGIADDLDLVFTTTVGTPLDRHLAWRHFQKVLRDASLERMRVHDLRHGTASLWLAAGIDLKTISELLGHSSIQITADLYAGVAEELKRNAADRLDALLGRSVPPQARAAGDK